MGASRFDNSSACEQPDSVAFRGDFLSLSVKDCPQAPLDARVGKFYTLIGKYVVDDTILLFVSKHPSERFHSDHFAATEKPGAIQQLQQLKRDYASTL
jgi:hypothetical protein